MSNALRRLREKLNDPLFIRTSDGMVPTAYAESIIHTVSSSLAELRNCLSATSVFASDTKHNFRLMMGDYNGAIVLPRVLSELQVSAPNITLTTTHIDRNSAYEKLRAGRTDVVITTELNGPGLYQQQLFEDAYVTLVGKAQSEVSGDLNLEKFCDIPHVLFSLEGRGTSNVDVALDKLSRQRQVALRVPHVSVIPQVLESVPYLATLPLRLAEVYLQRYDLKVYEPPVELKQLKVYQYWHSRQHHDPACIWLRSQIKGVF